MIGDPVSFPKVRQLVENHYDDRFHVISVTENEIMEGMLTANRHGHVVCTQGGESIAGLKKALNLGKLSRDSVFVVDSTSHQLKFANFQQMYFEDEFDSAYGISTEDNYKNRPVPLNAAATEIAEFLDLKKRQ